MISAMPAVAVRREREKNRQGKLVGDPFGRGATSYIPGHQLHLPIAYYHPHQHHHHHHQGGKSTNQRCNNNSASSSSVTNNCLTNCSTGNSEEKAGLRFLIYSGFGCLTIGLICLFIGIVTIKIPTQIIGVVFIGLGGLFCVIKIILSSKSSSSESSSSPRVTTTTTRVKTNCGDGSRDHVDNNRNNLNLIRSSSNNQTLTTDCKQTVQPISLESMNNLKPAGESFDCLNQTTKSIDQQTLEAS